MVYFIILGAISALIAQTATYPLDITRRRLQTDGFYNPVTHKYERDRRYNKSIIKVL